jgi:flagellar biosynthesis protein FliR
MLEAKLILFTYVLARVAGLALTAPIFGTAAVPISIRGLFAAALAMLIAPTQWQAAVANPDNLIYYLVLLGAEALIGACLGLGVLILVHAMTLAGELVGQGSGLTLSDVLDPSLDENIPLFSRLLFLLTVAAFLCMGGHRLVMAGLLDTFKAIPPGGGTFPNSLANGFVALIGQSFSLGIRAAAPAVTALLLATLTLGLVGRTIPQLNVLSLGFGLNAMLAFAALGLTIGAAVWAFQDQIQPALEILFDALKTPLQTQWLS